MRTNSKLEFLRFAWTTLIALVLAIPVVCHAAAAGWKPEQNVEIVVFTPPGAGADRAGRFIQQLLTEKKLIDVPATVVNKPGGGTTVGLTYLNQHSGNGHYFMVITPTGLTGYITGASSINYTDITPLAILSAEYAQFLVVADSPLKTGKNLADRLKANPAGTSIAFASSLGGLNHIAAAQMMKAIGGNIKSLKTVVFNGSGEAITAMLGGHVDLVVGSAPILPLLEAGKLRILAIASEKRLSGAMSSVPTWKEQGIDVVARDWRGLVGPKGMTEAQIRYWDDVFARMVQIPEWKQDLVKNQTESAYLSASETRKFMETEYATLSSILGELGMAQNAPATSR